MDSNSLYFTVFIILVALAFDFVNGFHDSANSIATVVSTRVLSPRVAVLWAGFFNFVAILLIGEPVAKTVGTGIIRPEIVHNLLILSALAGAIGWNLITWWFGLPSSSSHALIGGLIGVGLVEGGSHVLVWEGILKTTIFIVLSPAIGMVLGLSIMVLVLNLSRNSTLRRVDTIFRRLQLLSAAVYSSAHGMNDAQKTMGNHCAGAVSRRLSGSEFPYSLLGHYGLLYRHRHGDHGRRLANCANHGKQDHQAAAERRLQR